MSQALQPAGHLSPAAASAVLSVVMKKKRQTSCQPAAQLATKHLAMGLGSCVSGEQLPHSRTVLTPLAGLTESSCARGRGLDCKRNTGHLQRLLWLHQVSLASTSVCSAKCPACADICLWRSSIVEGIRACLVRLSP